MVQSTCGAVVLVESLAFGLASPAAYNAKLLLARVAFEDIDAVASGSTLTAFFDIVFFFFFCFFWICHGLVGQPLRRGTADRSVVVDIR